MPNSSRREFLIGTSTAVLSSGLLTGSGTAAANPTKTHSDGGFVNMGDIVETGSGELVHVRPGETAPRTEQSSVTTASNGELTVTAVTVPIGPSFPSDGTAEIWVGTHHETEGVSEPVENEPLTVTITRPDDEKESFDVETGSEGNKRVEYDLSDSARGEGRYEVAVDHDEVSQPAIIDFAVGTVVDITTRTWEPAPIGRDVTVSALARNGEDPVSDVDIALSVTDPDDTVIAETVETTDDDGFVTISTTPEETGRYNITAEVDDDTEPTHPRQASGNLTVVDVGTVSSLILRHAISGQTNVYGGYLTDNSGMVTNTTLTLEFAERFGDEEVILEEQVTTDENGFFILEFDLPADVTDDLEIEAELDDGRELMLSVDRLRVNEFDEDDSEEVSLDASFSDWVNSPGADAKIEIEAEDGGDPIANTDVDLALRYEWNGPIMFSTTVTTSDSGTATVTVPIPETAPDGAWLDGEASIQYDGTVRTDSLSTDIREYNINFSEESNIGDESEFSVEVTDRQSEEPVEGVPLLYDAQYAYSAAGSFDRGSLVSGDDGTDRSYVRIPEDVQFLEYANYRSRYQELVYRWLEPDYPGELSVSQDSVAAGDTINIEFSTPDDSVAQGIVFGDVGSPRKSLGDSIATDGSTSITIPDHVAGEWLLFRLWATDGNGQLYSDSVSVDIEDDPEEPDEEPDVDTILTLDNVGTDAWQLTNIDGDDVDAPINEDNPTIELEENVRYRIENNGWDAHPFAFESSDGTVLLSQNGDGEYEDDETVEWINEGEEVEFTLSESLAGELSTYVCTVHGSMEGLIGSDPDESDDEHIEAPGDVEIPSEYAEDDGTVGSNGLLDAGTDFENGEADIDTLLDVGTAFQNS